MSITRIGDACLYCKGSLQYRNHTHITLKDIFLIPFMTKKPLNISKRTTHVKLIIKFLCNICFPKDKLKGHVLLQGLPNKGLYSLLHHSNSSSTTIP